VRKAVPSKRVRWPQGWKKSLWVIPGLGLVIKFIIIAQVPGNGWLGADGENYLKGLEFLIRDGFLSEESILHYWPAGYPLLMWILGALTPTLTVPIMAVLQSVLYAFSTAFFTQKLYDSTLRRFALPAALILTVSPTLALNTIAIGYELISASSFLLALGLFISLSKVVDPRPWDWRILLIGVVFSFNNFVQPRFLLSSVILFSLSAIFLFKRRSWVVVVLVGLILSLLLPSVLIARNILANDFSAVSTNLGKAFQLGAGEDATGAHVPSYQGLDCPTVDGNASEVDQALVRCTISWYLDNPSQMFRLAFNKSLYFWSPWFGPLANGSMARNPWLKIHPFYDLATQTQEGYDLVYGPFGKAVSWIWFSLYIGFAIYGAVILWRRGGLERNLAVIVSTLILVNWFISLGTLGDHRQRLPILSIILFLQIIGLSSVRFTSKKKKNRKKRS